jgi:voltage-gated potassium channel
MMRPRLIDRFVERRFTAFLGEPVSVHAAARVIVSATGLVVVGAGVLMRFLDPHDFGNVWLGLWWSVQTVTTVGYGDITPKTVGGRIVATVVMLEGIAFVALVTAAITSAFVARAQRLPGRIAGEGLDSLAASYAEIAGRLDRIEAAIAELTGREAAKPS